MWGGRQRELTCAAGHPFCISVADRYAHCYLCNEYILNDTHTGEIASVQVALEALAAHEPEARITRSGRRVAPAPAKKAFVEPLTTHAEADRLDRLHTAVARWQSTVLFKVGPRRPPLPDTPVLSARGPGLARMARSHCRSQGGVDSAHRSPELRLTASFHRPHARFESPARRCSR